MKKFALIILSLYFALFFVEQTHLLTSDIGRHVVNGRVILSAKEPITTNLYSYTKPDQPVIYHHWGSGVLYALVHRSLGFEGLTLLNILICLGAFLIIFLTTRLESRFVASFISATLLIPLIGMRNDVRPESISLLLIAVFYYALTRFKLGQLKFAYLACMLIPLQILWVNMHIFFVFGPFLIICFAIHEIAYPMEKAKRANQYALLLIGVFLACIINPHGIHGLLIPLMIFKNYGYMLAENQSILFWLNRLHANVDFRFFLYSYHAVLTLLIGFVLITKVIRGLRPFPLHHAIPVLTFGLLSWNAIRAIPIAALILMPYLANQTQCFINSCNSSIKKWVQTLFIVLAIALITNGLVAHDSPFSPWRNKVYRGWGLIANSYQSALFFKSNKIKGPIFNNYDIGSYLIYHLFPSQRVFVDNRPEAYDEDFFKNIYIPMQQDETLWKKLSEQYKLNVIYFYRKDQTPWAQPFLIRRIKDSNWVPVYVDAYTIILLKNNAQNSELIKTYALPKNTFKFSTKS